MIVTIILTLILMLLFFLMELVAAYFYPHPFIINYFPEDVKEKAKNHKPPFKSAPVIGWILIILIFIGFIACSVYAGIDGGRNGFGYIDYLIRFLIMGYGLKAFDIIFFDYFILTNTGFFQHFYPETKGCAGWKQFGYNRKDQIKQLILFLPTLAIVALICCLTCSS